jgi:leucyl-tRNA synthetase
VIIQLRFLKRINLQEAAKKAIEELEKLNQGYGKRITVCGCRFLVKDIGEPFPVYYVNGLPQMIDAYIYQLCYRK